MLSLEACSGPAPRCADVDAGACDDLPPPTYAELYAAVLRPSCGVDGPSCHGSGSDSPLSFTDEAASLAYLRAQLVQPGVPQCSELYLRVTSTDRFFRMPPSSPLPEASRCAIARWIEDGAR